VNPSQPEFNPYAPPRAPEAELESSDPPPLAELPDRFAAAVVDGVAVFFVLGIAQTVVARFGGVLYSVYSVGWTAFEIVVWVAINGYFLATTSQTLGKRLFSLQIVNVDDDRPAPFAKIVLLRRLPMALVYVIPMFGVFVYYAGIVLIFAAQRRCLHDMIAGTKVVDLGGRKLIRL
jgi:uncharacterized RDD family membrane protein YckC